MFKPDSEEAVWFQYITKLNDRAFSKRRSSGFTTWAICGVLAILSFKILDRLPIIVNTPDIRPLFLFTLSTSANLSCSVIILFFGLLSGGIPASESRLMPKLSRTTKPIVFLPLIVIGFSIAFINFYTGYIDKSYYLPWWPYYLFGIYHFVNIALPLGKKIKTLIKLKGEYQELPHLDTPPYLLESRIKLFFGLAIIMVGMVLTCCSFFTLYYLLKNSLILNHIDLIKFSLEIIAFLILAILLLGRISTAIRQQFLETLERRIVFEELTADQIKDIFIKEYLGETTREWVLMIESRMKELCDNYLKAVDDAKNELEKMDQINKEYKYEIDGRKKEICNKAQKPLNEYLSFVEKIISHVDHLAGEGAFFSDKELIQRITSSWKSQITDIKASFNNLCGTCKLFGEVDSNEAQKCKECPVEQSAEGDAMKRVS